VPRRVRMPAADELFRTTTGNGTLVREGREAREAREEGAERAARDRGHNPVAPPNAAAPDTAGSTAPGKTVPAPAVSAEEAAAAVQASATGATAVNAANAAAVATASGVSAESAVSAPAPVQAAPSAQAPSAPSAPSRKVTAPRRPSGRERHDEKITVYVSPDELIGLEHARIMLRGEYGLAVDRGRIVREAVAALLADLDARGRDSILVKRLSAGG
jgi:hypothetical protein